MKIFNTLLCFVMSLMLSAQSNSLTDTEKAMADEIGFGHEVLLLLRNKTGAEFIPIPVDETHTIPAIALRMNHFDVPAIVEDLQSRMLLKGYILFQSDQGDTSTDGLHEMRLLKTNDPLTPITYMQTSSSDPELSNETIYQKIEDWTGKYGFTVFGAGPKWLKVKVAIPLEETGELAEELIAFCPKLLSFHGNATFLANDLKERPRLELDWNNY